MIETDNNSHSLDFPPREGEISQPFVISEGLGEVDPETFWVGLPDDKILILKKNSQEIVDRDSLPCKPDVCVYLGRIESNFQPDFEKLEFLTTKHFVENSKGACSECRDREREDMPVIPNHSHCHYQNPFVLDLEIQNQASCNFVDSSWKWSYHP